MFYGRLKSYFQTHELFLGLLIVLIVGAFQGFGITVPSLSFLSWFCFVPTFYLLEKKEHRYWKHAFILGTAHGFATSVTGLYWIVETLERFSGHSKLMCLLFAALIFLFYAFQGTLIYVLLHVAIKHQIRRIIALVAIVIPIDFLYPELFPIYFSSGLSDMRFLIQILDLGGPLLLSSLVVLINVAIFESIDAIRNTKPIPWSIIGASIVSIGLSLLYGCYRIYDVESKMKQASSINVGAVQLASYEIGSKKGRKTRYTSMVRETNTLKAMHPEMELIVWPESSYPYGLSERRLANPIFQFNVPIIFNASFHVYEQGKDVYFNAAILLDERSRMIGTYYKNHLVPFGEYMPFEHVFSFVKEYFPFGSYTPGTSFESLILKRKGKEDVRMSVLICYENIMPEYARRYIHETKSNLLINLTNDMWYGDTTQPWTHLSLSQIRAVEHHRSVVRSTITGVSAFVDPTGKIIDYIGPYQQGSLHGSLPLITMTTWYEEIGNWPGWGACLMFCLMFLSILFKDKVRLCHMVYDLFRRKSSDCKRARL